MRSVMIVSDGRPYGARIVDATTGEPIRGIAKAVVTLTPDGVEAVLEVAMVQTSMDLSARFKAHNPTTGRLEELASLTFADGTVVEF